MTGDISRREVLSAGGGVVAGGIGGIAISPSLRRAASDLWADWMLPDSPIESVVLADDALVIGLIENPAISVLNVIAPSGEAAVSYQTNLVESQEYRVSRSRLDPGRYRVVAARDREVVDSRFIEIPGEKTQNGY